VKRAHTRYIFPTLLMPIFKFFLKSKNLKSLMISPKSHSTITLTELRTEAMEQYAETKKDLKVRVVKRGRPK